MLASRRVLVATPGTKGAGAKIHPKSRFCAILILYSLTLPGLVVVHHVEEAWEHLRVLVDGEFGRKRVKGRQRVVLKAADADEDELVLVLVEQGLLVRRAVG